MYALIHPDVPKIENPYWYQLPVILKNFDRIVVGSIVRIELHGRRARGWVLELSETLPDTFDVGTVKSVIEYVSDGPPQRLVDFADILSRYYLYSPVMFLRAASPDKIVRSISYKGLPGDTSRHPEDTSRHPEGTSRHPEDPEGSQETLHLVDPRANRRELIDECISDTGSTIIVTPRGTSRIAHYLDTSHNVVEYIPGEKTHADAYQRATQSKTVIVGGRKALFAPSSDVESIIILDDAYEQLTDERSPRWNATVVARKYAQQFRCECHVITSVPSVETYGMALDDRRENKSWPKIHVYDTREDDPVWGAYPPVVIDSVSNALKAGVDAALIVNNTALSKLVICTTCGVTAHCEKCGHSVHEKNGDEFVCPICATQRPHVCSECKGSSFKKYRRGVNAIAQECRALFPDVNVFEVFKDADVSSIDRRDQKPSIFVATEALFHRAELTKNLGVVIFPDVDSLLYRPGMTSFLQALVFINRALRAIKKTEIRAPIVLLTKNSETPVLKDLSRGDFVSLRERDLSLRSSMKLAPFFATAEITGSSPRVTEALKEIDDDIVVGATVDGENTTVMLNAHTHEILENKAYDALRRLASRSRYTVSVDIYD